MGLDSVPRNGGGMSRRGRRARAILALDGVSADGRNRDRGGTAALEALRDMVSPTDTAPTGLDLFAGPPSNPLGELLAEYDDLVDDYGAPAGRGVVELLARVAAGAVTELAARRERDPERVLLGIVKQFGQVDDEDE